jgi:hypothetical protein
MSAVESLHMSTRKAADRQRKSYCTSNAKSEKQTSDWGQCSKVEWSSNVKPIYFVLPWASILWGNKQDIYWLFYVAIKDW